MTDEYRKGLLAAAKMLEVSRQAIRLAAGEMTGGEMRTVLAVLAWRKRMIEQLAETT